MDKKTFTLDDHTLEIISQDGNGTGTQVFLDGKSINDVTSAAITIVPSDSITVVLTVLEREENGDVKLIGDDRRISSQQFRFIATNLSMEQSATNR